MEGIPEDEYFIAISGDRREGETQSKEADFMVCVD